MVHWLDFSFGIGDLGFGVWGGPGLRVDGLGS